jgi:hypothetical protein
MTALEYVHEHMNFRSNKAMLSTSNPADDSTPYLLSPDPPILADMQ